MSNENYEEKELNKEVKLCITEFVNNIMKYIENPEEKSPLNANKEIINKINSDEFAYLAFYELRNQLTSYYNELLELIKQGKIEFKKFKQITGMLMIISLFIHTPIGEVCFFNEGYIENNNNRFTAQEIKFRRYYLDVVSNYKCCKFKYSIDDIKRIMNNFSFRAVDMTNFRIKQCIHLGGYINDADFVKHSLIKYMKAFYCYYNEFKEMDIENSTNIHFIFSYIKSFFNKVIREKIKL